MAGSISPFLSASSWTLMESLSFDIIILILLLIIIIIIIILIISIIILIILIILLLIIIIGLFCGLSAPLSFLNKQTETRN